MWLCQTGNQLILQRLRTGAALNRLKGEYAIYAAGVGFLSLTNLTN